MTANGVREESLETNNQNCVCNIRDVESDEGTLSADLKYHETIGNTEYIKWMSSH